MAKKTGTLSNNPGNIVEQPITDILSEKYLAYALSTITARSLPDVRDGMKPVHRRLLFAMHQLSLRSTTAPKKSARVVGDVIGKFHPHGDQSVYDALVRLAQEFAVRYPLVDGQGNFGNIDGDNAAAMRYTEARLTRVAELLLEGIDEDAVDFRATYDGETLEPIVMPAGFPNLLANGSSGIAVGMATNIPPHNVAELCAAMEAMIDGDPTIAELVKFIPGPDFPTGGILVEDKADIIEAYTKGRGSFRVRAKWKVEETKNSYQIVVTEIPYQVAKAKMIEDIAKLIVDKKLPLVDDIRDESAEDVRLILVPKSKGIAPELMMESLFRTSALEVKFGLNLNVLEQGRNPRVLSLKEALQDFLNHRQDVLVRRSTHRLAQVDHRLEILAGYLVAYLNLDKVIKIIRTEDEPKEKLMKAFKLTEIQADAILNMRLRSLRKLEEMEIRGENADLLKEKESLEQLLGSEKRQWTTIKKQIQKLGEEFAKSTPLGKRRTEIGRPAKIIAEVSADAFVEKEPITIICSAQGWIRAMKGHEINLDDVKYKEGDEARFALKAMTNDKILVFASNGRFYTLSGDKLPSGRGWGEPIRLMVDLPAQDDIISMFVYAEGNRYLVASDDGRGFIVRAEDGLAQTKNGKVILNVDDGVKAIVCRPIDPISDHVAAMGTNRKMVVFPLSELPEMARGKGVALQKFKGGKLADAITFNMKIGMPFADGRGTVKMANGKLWLAARASQGKLPPEGFKRDNTFGI
ncbi:MAG TPA: DNA topoisomerase IV subunit A [Alphaproteobacteria bacterium]